MKGYPFKHTYTYGIFSQTGIQIQTHSLKNLNGKRLQGLSSG